MGVISTEDNKRSAIFVDKVYHGVQELLCGVHEVKKPQGSVLNISQELSNTKVSADNFTVETFFGPLGQLWTVMRNKWIWTENNYDNIIRVCVALKNLHICKYHLRATDFEFYQKHMTLLLLIDMGQAEKRRQKKMRYREKRRRRKNQKLWELSDDVIQSPE